MSALGSVLAAVQAGVPEGRLAASLGLDGGLVEMALEYWLRVGVITRASDLTLGCGTCPPPAQRTGKCLGCPFA